jgi:hypothetical protein
MYIASPETFAAVFSPTNASAVKMLMVNYLRRYGEEDLHIEYPSGPRRSIVILNL